MLSSLKESTLTGPLLSSPLSGLLCELLTPETIKIIPPLGSQLLWDGEPMLWDGQQLIWNASQPGGSSVVITQTVTWGGEELLWDGEALQWTA